MAAEFIPHLVKKIVVTARELGKNPTESFERFQDRCAQVRRKRDDERAMKKERGIWTDQEEKVHQDAQLRVDAFFRHVKNVAWEVSLTEEDQKVLGKLPWLLDWRRELQA
jgi:hypothetical protein